MGADVSSPGPWVRAASGWSRRPLFLRFGTTDCDLASASMLFPTIVLEFPLSPLPAPQLTFTKPHCRPSYRDSSLHERTSLQGLEPFPPSRRNLPVALFQASCCGKCFSRSGTRCFLFASLYLHKLQVCLFLMEVPGWYMYVINI